MVTSTDFLINESSVIFDLYRLWYMVPSLAFVNVLAALYLDVLYSAKSKLLHTYSKVTYFLSTVNNFQSEFNKPSRLLNGSFGSDILKSTVREAW